MARLPSPNLRKRPRLEIIPFIDIMFFLLATFMMASLAMVANEGLDLNLPQTAEPAPLSEEMRDRTLSVDAEGDVYYRRELLSSDGLTLQLREWHEEDPERAVIVQGDADCAYGDVVRILDQARRIGLSGLVLRTRTTPQP